MGDPILAWHFLRPDGKLRDGATPPPDGEWLTHDGAVEICQSGLHASVRAIDALTYAPGSIVCRVEMRGDLIVDRDKIVGRERSILWRYDATSVLRHFARRQALSVIHLWDAPCVVRRYLETGDESIRAAAMAAARAAAMAAANVMLTDMLEAWKEVDHG